MARISGNGTPGGISAAASQRWWRALAYRGRRHHRAARRQRRYRAHRLLASSGGALRIKAACAHGAAAAATAHQRAALRSRACGAARALPKSYQVAAAARRLQRVTAAAAHRGVRAARCRAPSCAQRRQRAHRIIIQRRGISRLPLSGGGKPRLAFMTLAAFRAYGGVASAKRAGVSCLRWLRCGPSISWRAAAWPLSAWRAAAAARQQRRRITRRQARGAGASGIGVAPALSEKRHGGARVHQRARARRGGGSGVFDPARRHRGAGWRDNGNDGRRKSECFAGGGIAREQRRMATVIEKRLKIIGVPQQRSVAFWRWRRRRWRRARWPRRQSGVAPHQRRCSGGAWHRASASRHGLAASALGVAHHWRRLAPSRHSTRGSALA